MPQPDYSEDRKDEQRRILLITEDPLLRTLISGFLVTMGCACAMVAARDMDAIIEHETFDDVLMDVGQSRASLADALKKINQNRPGLSERMLLIRRSPGDIEAIQFMGPQKLPYLSETVQMERLWAILQERFKSTARVKPLPRRMSVGQVLFDSSSAPVAAGIRGGLIDYRRLAYQHDDATVDLLIGPIESSGKISVTGQVLRRGSKSHGNEGLPVLLVGGGRTVARAMTNPFGEFSFKGDPAEDGCVEIRLGESTWISIRLEKVNWGIQRAVDLEKKE